MNPCPRLPGAAQRSRQTCELESHCTNPLLRSNRLFGLRIKQYRRYQRNQLLQEASRGMDITARVMRDRPESTSSPNGFHVQSRLEAFSHEESQANTTCLFSAKHGIAPAVLRVPRCEKARRSAKQCVLLSKFLKPSCTSELISQTDRPCVTLVRVSLPPQPVQSQVAGSVKPWLAPAGHGT